MYTTQNFRTKKALKAAVSAYLSNSGPAVTIFNPGPIGETPKNGTVVLEGPHYPERHAWYAEAKLENGVVVKVK